MEYSTIYNKGTIVSYYMDNAVKIMYNSNI